jgi:hypothetical protein
MVGNIINDKDIGINDETLLSPCMDNNEPLAFGHKGK